MVSSSSSSSSSLQVGEIFEGVFVASRGPHISDGHACNNMTIITIDKIVGR